MLNSISLSYRPGAQHQNGATYSQEKEALGGLPSLGRYQRKRQMVKGGEDQKGIRELKQGRAERLVQVRLRMLPLPRA